MTLYHLYSDGNYFPRAKKSGFGGYIEESPGISLVEYTEQIKLPKYAHSFELLGIIRGLQIAKLMGVEHLQSHCDDKHTVTRLQETILIGNTSQILPKSKPELYQEILDLSKDFKTISFNYIPRNKNKHSDSLSRRYSLLMEKKFLHQFKNDLDKAEEILSGNETVSKKIFFSHPSLIRIQYKNNPFLVSQHRNKKIRKISKLEEIQSYDFLFIESISSCSHVTYNGFYYSQATKEKQLIKNQIFDFNDLENFCQFFTDCTAQLIQKKVKNLWTYTNSRMINNYFENKEKVPSTSVESFKKIYNNFTSFDKILFHSFPFEHKFSPEITLVEKEKKKLGDSIESLDSLMEQMQNGALHRDNKKNFGLLVRHHLRNYKNILERDLNDIEKHEIIQKTTDELVAKGFLNIPDFKKLKV